MASDRWAPRDPGSSPQVRGILIPRFNWESGCGIIPAGAGHLLSLSATRCFRGGSSPQVRGICRLPVAGTAREGIIPAGAGHFIWRDSKPGNFWDHPRRCGAFYGGNMRAATSRGSSPQVRGICLLVSLSVNIHGIIPAGAGHLHH